MKRLFSTINNNSINITNNAWFKMNKIKKKKKNYNFLFNVTSGGCSGFNFNLKLIDENKFKEFYNTKSKILPTVIKKNNIKVLIDPVSELFLLGTTIDFIFEDFDKGIFENKFIFIPDKNLASTCGCGISFTLK